MAGKHLTIEDISKDNFPYYVEEPNKNFSRERNYAVINQVIVENDQMQRKLHKEVENNAGNVADILASFAKYKLDSSDGNKQIEQWLGKSWMTKIYGEKLIDKIRMREILQKENIKKGNTKFSNFYLK